MSFPNLGRVPEIRKIPDSSCPHCEDGFLEKLDDQTLWCPECGYHSGTSVMYFGVCPNCGLIEPMRYEDGLFRCVDSECGCTVRLDCAGIEEDEDYPGDYIVTQLKKAEILPGATAIDSDSLANFSNLEEVILPEGIEEIGKDAFSGCISLKRINIPATVRKIGPSAFRDCAFAEISLPEGIEIISRDAFSGCMNLKHISLPATLKKIESYAFSGCAITELTLPDGIQEIAGTAFYGCTALRRVNLPRSLTRLAEDAFSDCPNLTLERKDN